MLDPWPDARRGAGARQTWSDVLLRARERSRRGTARDDDKAQRGVSPLAGTARQKNAVARPTSEGGRHRRHDLDRAAGAAHIGYGILPA